MSPIQFGWSIPLPSGTAVKMDTASFLAELHKGLHLINGHFASVWTNDHLQFGNAALLEGWTALTYLAATYPQMMFGNMVLNQSFRNPALLAKMAATFQYMSEGRLLLGLGAGWHEEEYRAYGYPFPSARARVDQLAEALAIIKALWSEERTTFEGQYYRISDAYCEPRPTPIPPIVVGGTKPRSLHIAARYADWWNVARPSIEDYRAIIQVCEQACLAVQRDPSSLRRTWFGNCLCAYTEADLATLKKASVVQNYDLSGTPAQVIEQMQQFINLGVDYFILEIGEFPDLTTLEVLVQEVLPLLNA